MTETRGPDDVQRLADAYSAGAAGYAESWSPVIHPIGRRLIEALPWSSARRVLDIATGAGAHVPDIRRWAPGAWVVGVDRSPGMLELARQHDVPLVQMDAVDLAIRDACIDVAVMAFVLFHLGEPVAALQEVARVLRGGGAVGTATWAEEPEFEASRVWDAELDAHGAVDPAPLPKQNDDPMNTPEKMANLFLAAGLEPVRVWLERLEHQWDAERFIALRTTFGRSRRKIGSLDVPTRVTFVDRARHRLSRLRPEDFVYRAAVVCGVAARPR